MDFFSILTLLGGLAMFLYGMQVMGDGLEKLSGGKLEKILENLSSNRVKAVLVGAAVTAVIQSSSATTVMVVGFVNSGIMHLSQAVGFIMGANIGTTVTAWILSLAGIESSNFFVRLLNPSSFSPILAMIGVVFIVFLHNEKKKDIGHILVGFAVLMFGMNTMSGAVKPLAQVPEFTNILLKFTNPGSWCTGRRSFNGCYPVILCFCWYPSGIVCNRCSSVQYGTSYYYGTEYRNLYHSNAFFCWCN